MRLRNQGNSEQASSFRIRATKLFVLFSLAVSAQAVALHDPSQPIKTPKCAPDSPAGQIWLAENQWRYGNPDDPDPKKAKEAREKAVAALNAIEVGQSPWPNWFDPADSVLPSGTRFQMAMSAGQADDRPGGWGTFNNIKTVQDVRDYLAVLPEFKPDIDRINTYVVGIAMPVQMGPVGPQIDATKCTLLPGGWSQFNMLSSPPDRVKYFSLESSRKITDFGQ